MLISKPEANSRLAILKELGPLAVESPVGEAVEIGDRLG